VRLLVLVNTVEAETLCEITEDDVEADHQEDGGGGGVKTAGSCPGPGQGSQETELGGEARLGQLIVLQPHNPRHQSDCRSDDGGSVTPENSGQGGEEDTGGVLVLDHGHPRHDLPHPLHLLDTPQEAEHDRMSHKVEDTILGTEIQGDPDHHNAHNFPVTSEGVSGRQPEQHVGQERSRQAGDQHGETGGERRLAGLLFPKLQPECEGRDQVVSQLKERETQPGQVVEQHLLHLQAGLTVFITQQTFHYGLFVEYFLALK